MKDCEIYLRAAETIDDPQVHYNCACWAISLQTHPGQFVELQNSDSMSAFTEWFCPTQEEQIEYLGGTWQAFWFNNSHERTLALCFMAAIAKSEGR